MHVEAHLRSAQTVLEHYDGKIPLAAWLKNYFAQHKKFGSRDRRQVADLCFCFFRTGLAFPGLSVRERLLAGQFLCHAQTPYVQAFKPEWMPMLNWPAAEKFRFLSTTAEECLFPFPDAISGAIEKSSFALSHLQQPDLFLRIRPGREKDAIAKLEASGISFEKEKQCLRLPITSKVDTVLSIDKEVVVQDISSQRVLEPLQQHVEENPFSAWDCCAASGGKTILLYDTYRKARLTVSDVRESILINLKSRLKRAGISAFHAFVADVSSPSFTYPQKFNVVVCDAPCSGSGTWGRTPEQLVFFKREKIGHYTTLQKKIAANAGRSLNPGGFFLYITCSVFQEENEDVVAYLQEKTDLKLVAENYYIGYDKKGDTLFTALFTI